MAQGGREAAAERERRRGAELAPTRRRSMLPEAKRGGFLVILELSRSSGAVVGKEGVWTPGLGAHGHGPCGSDQKGESSVTPADPALTKKSAL
jgi:hypothetical protein